jgi:putative tricarboxylic transport membrane protein
LEGIAASESANNGACGATMIPLLALGVPGDVITGVMLGAFMIQGLTPGPLLFQTNIHEVYMLFIGMMMSSVLLFGAGKVTMRMFSYVAHIPQTLLTPLVLMLCLFGIYSISSSMFDVAILLIMGVVGFGMFLLNIPAAPFLIAFILGPMIEENLRRALAISRGDPAVLLSSPITWIFAVLIVFVVGLTVRREILKFNARKA